MRGLIKKKKRKYNSKIKTFYTEMVKNMLRKYLKTPLYPDGLEKVNKTLKM